MIEMVIQMNEMQNLRHQTLKAMLKVVALLQVEVVKWRKSVVLPARRGDRKSSLAAAQAG